MSFCNPVYNYSVISSRQAFTHPVVAK